MRAILILLLLVPASYAAEIKFIGSQGLTNVYFACSNQMVQLTHFHNRQHIYDAQISPTQRYAFVWHMDFSPRRIQVVDLKTLRSVADFIPGVDGQLAWSADDRIVLIYGFGTGRYATIYDVSGQKLFATEPSFDLFEKCSIEMDPSGRALVMIPNLWSTAGQIELVRTSDEKILKIGPKSVSDAEWSWHGQTLMLKYSTNPSANALEVTTNLLLPEGW